MKIISVVLAVLFIAFAALQYNDPDPLLWMIVYGYVALIPILYLMKIYPVKTILFSIIVLAIFSCFYIPGVIDWLRYGTVGEITQEMKAKKPYIEESREFLGLMIALASLFFYYIKEKRMAAGIRGNE
ncbi:hypothetical protein C900_01363 [Fulvivirga imtechensis AK7]|uniref:Transmembrane family 220, helix n=1 Tax=Fulvivirga imtechensis AK7 TaxID=1237149 RepID=L8K045_9BACT|nr:transmembrane 220 family protein [Fulvivirga imtechensis]ELR73753.1 hypothetical protein C900_01363 [Fulvivirga imtechensis AK7]